MLKNVEILVILAGGKGTRLGSLGIARPKPVIRINKVPLIFYIIDWAKKQNFKKIVIAGGHNFKVLKKEIEMFLSTSSTKVASKTYNISHKNFPEIILKNTGINKETAERVYDLKELLLNDERFVLTYGDTLTDLNILPIVTLSEQKNSTICFVAGYPDARYGEITLKKNLVTKFVEKERPKFLVNRGFFVIKKGIFQEWDKNTFISFERDVVPFFVEKENVFAEKDEAWFFSVDTEVDAKNLENELIKRKIFLNMEN